MASFKFSRSSREDSSVRNFVAINCPTIDLEKFSYSDYQFVDDVSSPTTDITQQLIVANAESTNITINLSTVSMEALYPQIKIIVNVGLAPYIVTVHSTEGDFSDLELNANEFTMYMYSGGMWNTFSGSGGGGGGGGTGGGGTGAGALDKLFWNPGNSGTAVFPVAGSGDTRAYYPHVLHDETAPFSPDGGTTMYKYVGLYTGNGTTLLTFCFSNDGLAWVSPIKVTGIALDGYHGQMAIVDSTIRLWYWAQPLIYDPAAVRTATCSILQIPQFSGDVPCQNGTVPWIEPAPAWNRGSYGPAALFYNPAPTSIPGQPETFRYYGFMDLTTGGVEDLGLVTGDDGITWDLAYPTAIIPRGTGGSWDDTYISFCSIWHPSPTNKTEWGMFFSGGTLTSVDGPSDGIGFAYAQNLLSWTKHSANPVFTNGSGNWLNRCYTPCIVLTTDSLGRTQLRLYYTGDGAAGRFVYVAEEELHWMEKATTSADTDNQGLRLP